MRVVFELKPVDATGLGGDLLRNQGFRETEGSPNCFEKQIIGDVGQETTDTRQFARPFLEVLMDEGILPRRVHVQIRDIGGPSFASAMSAAAKALEEAAELLD